MNDMMTAPQLRTAAHKLLALADRLEAGGQTAYTNFQQVGQFHTKFGLDVSNGRTPHHIPVELEVFRVAFLREELEELEEAYRDSDLPKIADALVDLVYVALGTAHLHGFPWEELFAEVQRVNMMKVRAQEAKESTRLSTFDVVKPEGWKPPNIIEVLMRAGWPGPELPLSE